MERLWTPWRMGFVQTAGDAPAKCFLCDGPAIDTGQDRANLIAFRGPRVFVVLNLYPYNSGHLLVAPYQHVSDFASLDPDLASELMATTQRAVRVLQAAYQPEGFNVGLNLGKPAGAGVPGHLHVHVVPRWNGDTNFMPVLGETKVLPEAIADTYERLAPLFAELS